MTVSRVGDDRWLVHAMDTVFSLVIPEDPTKFSPRPPAARDDSAGTPRSETRLASESYGHRVQLGEDGDGLVQSIADDWYRTEARLSVFIPDSEINRWSRHEIGDDELSPDTRAVIEACDWLKDRAGGVFDARREGGYNPTGYVKGWAIARAGHTLDEAGVVSYFINGGGDILARGTSPRGTEWRIGIAHPYRPGEMATVVTGIPGDGRPVAVATSGTSERGRHIVNPVTGWRPERASVTVVGHDIALADAVATAALAVGGDGAGASASMVRQFGLEAFGFSEDTRPWWTPGIADYAMVPRLN